MHINQLSSHILAEKLITSTCNCRMHGPNRPALEILQMVGLMLLELPEARVLDNNPVPDPMQPLTPLSLVSYIIQFSRGGTKTLLGTVHGPKRREAPDLSRTV